MAGSSLLGSGIPEVRLSSAATGSRAMPVIGFGTASNACDRGGLKPAVIEAIKLGYRHFDTATIYGSEQLLGEAIAEALQLRLISSRHELFITSKLWCSDAHPDLVLTALRNSLRNLQVEYVDLYLVHWPVSAKPGKYETPVQENELLPMDFKSVWASMEDCQRLNLTKSIGVSNFSSKKLQHILNFATIPPSVNQVEMNPTWQQKKLRQFCRMNNIVVTAYSPLGAFGTKWGGDLVMANETLNEIAKARGKSVAQVSLRWVYEQGTSLVVRSFNAEWTKENLEILEWDELTKEEVNKIDRIPQKKTLLHCFLSPNGPYKSAKELWDDDDDHELLT